MPIIPLARKLFTNHSIIGTNQEVQQVIRDNIDTTRSGETLRISIYIFTNTTTEAAISAALARGVSVSILSEQTKYVAGDQKDLLDRLAVAGAIIKLCQNSCFGTGLNHDKAVIADNWAIITSSNFSGSTRYEGGVKINRYEAPLVHDFLINRFNDQVSDVTDPGYSDVYQNGLGAYNAGPSATNFFVDWISLMDVNASGEAILEIAMGHFKVSTPIQNIITELRKLSKRGCVVNMIFSGDYDAQIHTWALASETATEEPFQIEWQENVHAKFMAFSGLYDGVQKTLTWAGSTNMTEQAITENDEVGVRSEHRADYVIYHSFFNTIEQSEVGTSA